MKKDVLDMACGSRMFWFDHQDPGAIYGDIRTEEHTLCDGRALKIRPDVVFDFTNLPFAGGLFRMVIFDPPHLIRAGEHGWMLKKYGRLPVDWREALSKGFSEAFRVLGEGGVLVFKWSQVQIRPSEVLALAQTQPIVGNQNSKRSGAHWICFMKRGEHAVRACGI